MRAHTGKPWDKSHVDAELGFPGGSDSKESTCNVGDMDSIPGLGRCPGGGHGNPVQYSCLENPHGQRSLVGYSPWGRKKSDTTEQLSTASEGVSLSLSSPVCLFTFTLLSPDKHFTCFTTFHFFMEIDFLQSCTGQALVTGQALSMTTGPRWFSCWYSAGLLPWPEFILWMENRNTAPRCSGRVHLRSVWNTYIHTHIYNTHIYI